MEWDTCAAHAILNACGGILELIDGEYGEELSYNKCNLLNPYFICRLKILADLPFLK
jgi:3'(2'), 5'-bisphosphate nucleotidase